MPPETLAQVRRDYLENQSMVTSPTEVVQVLYQIAINNVRSAIDYLKSGDHLSRARVVTKAEEAVDELILALDHTVGAQFTHTMADLYVYVLQQLVTGHARQSEQAFRDALTILESLNDTWTEVRARLNAEADGGAVSNSPETEPEVVTARDPYASYDSGCPVASGRDWSA
jgi:flagellar biosynthetic protein FliS